MPIHFQLSNGCPEQFPLQLELAPPLNVGVADPMESLLSWVQSIKEFSQIQAEQGADWVQIRFYFNSLPFCLHYEHYSDCYWIDADSQASLVILSELAALIVSIQHNHGLSQSSAS